MVLPVIACTGVNIVFHFHMLPSTILGEKAAVKEGKDIYAADHFIQVDQSGHRMRHTIGVTPCIVPKGLYVCTKSRSLLSGESMAALQGISRRELEAYKLCELSDRMLGNIAGNAFTASVATVFLIACVLHLQQHRDVRS